jgi:uncharacterized membrane protein YbaN (DUF454 family)
VAIISLVSLVSLLSSLSSSILVAVGKITEVAGSLGIASPSGATTWFLIVGAMLASS